jgi:hypothetical protein
LREFGVSHRAPLGRSGQTVAKPLLDPAEVWDLPADLDLPPAPPIRPLPELRCVCDGRDLPDGACGLRLTGVAPVKPDTRGELNKT